jgi:succinate dehydrogenase hydrophobic anchor subunit
MSANSAAHGTKHFKMHSLAGWGVIIGLPFAIAQAVMAIPAGPAGIAAWLSSATGAIGMIAFLSAAILYVKLEMDEVIMDYFSGGLRSFGLWKNRIVALILWVISVAGLILAAFV